MADFAEIALAQPQQHGAIDLAIAADEIMQARVKAASLAAVPPLFRLVMALDENLARVPIRALARKIVAAFKQEDSLAGLRQAPGHGAAAGTRADDHNVIRLSVHGPC